MKVMAYVDSEDIEGCVCCVCWWLTDEHGLLINIGEKPERPDDAHMILCKDCYSILRDTIMLHHEITEPQGGRYTETTREVDNGS